MRHLKKASKDIIWSFAVQLNRPIKHIGYEKNDVSISNQKTDGGYFELIINGTEYYPTTKREVYEILREVDSTFTDWWESCNEHYFEEK